jgi:predicted NAD/FAD-dependent oxidoreductase
MTLASSDTGWQVDGEDFEAVVLACTATEASRLTASLAATWSDCAAALRYEPIVTAYLHDPQLNFAAPMMALHANAEAPAQFAFDLGALGMAPATFAFVISGARHWVDHGLRNTGQAVLTQARMAFAGAFGAADDEVLRHIAAEQRATFACSPDLRRPPALIAPGLCAAGDYIEGPYPATLEGAVRSGEYAASLALPT